MEDKVTKEGVILLEIQEDGNWKGWMMKHEKLIEVRQIDPTTVLGLLLTHE